MSARIVSALASAKVKNSFQLLSQAKNKSEQTDSAFRLLESSLKASQFKAKTGESRIFYNVQGIKENVVVVTGLGEERTPQAERSASVSAIKELRSLDTNVPWNVVFEKDSDLDADDSRLLKARAEGATLATYSGLHHLKAKDKQPAPISLLSGNLSGANKKSWRTGEILAMAQNQARVFMETPANLLNPTLFCEKSREMFADFSNVKLFAREEEWIKDQGMKSFLSVAQGSRDSQPPRFLEIHYRGNKKNPDQPPLALVGKGVTFDSGGISLKPSADMSMMKGDMGGAAVVVCSLWAIAELQLPINVVAVCPLTENMPSASATKPGDVVESRKGLSIEVDNTDAEGRLILADALDYVSTTFKPSFVVELSTLTGAMDIALGEGYAGVFSTSDDLWNRLEAGGRRANDLFWRMPLSKDHYGHQITSTVADLKNVGGRSAGSITAALFLEHFVPKEIPFAHIDIAGVMHTRSAKGGAALLSPGMTGRPCRSIVEFASTLSAE